MENLRKYNHVSLPSPAIDFTTLFTPTHHIFTNIDHKKNYSHSLGEPGAASATRSNTPIVQNIEDLGHAQQHPAHWLEFS